MLRSVIKPKNLIKKRYSLVGTFSKRILIWYGILPSRRHVFNNINKDSFFSLIFYAESIKTMLYLGKW